MTAWVVFGGGGHHRSIIDVLTRRGDSVAIVADPALPRSSAQGGVEVMDDEQAIAAAASLGLPAILAVGANDVRLRLLDQLVDRGIAVPALIAATATVASDAVLGDGAVVLEHAHVGPGSIIGRACIVNTGAIVEHDVTVGDGAHVGPGGVLAGHARCGARSQIGAGAVLRPFAHVGSDTIIGAGAVVVTTIPQGAVAVGVPARPRG